MICYNCMHDKGASTVCPHCGTRDIPAPASHHLPPGTLVNNRYMMGRVLGEGGFGITYIALDTLLDNIVAIKEYYPDDFAHRDGNVSHNVSVRPGEPQEFFDKWKEYFLKEARNLARFYNKCGIVGIINFIEENNTAYIVMDYLDGIDLRHYLLRNGTLSVDKTIKMIMPVIRSLEQVHKAGIILRDISPRSLMVLSDGSAVLMDFGTARNLYYENPRWTVLPVQHYTPEEQYRRNGELGPWTNVYGICAIIYHCITGKPPEESIDRIFKDNLRRPSELGVDISPAMEEVLMYGLAVRKKDRCKDMAELRDKLEEAETTQEEIPDELLHLNTKELLTRLNAAATEREKNLIRAALWELIIHPKES